MAAVNDAIAAAAVLTFRLPMLWAMCLDPTPARRAEANRMMAEKSAAAILGVVCAQQQFWLETMKAWPLAVSGRLTPLMAAEAAVRIANTGAAPARQRLRANARRLGGRRPL